MKIIEKSIKHRQNSSTRLEVDLPQIFDRFSHPGPPVNLDSMRTGKHKDIKDFCQTRNKETETNSRKQSVHESYNQLRTSSDSK